MWESITHKANIVPATNKERFNQYFQRITLDESGIIKVWKII